jgi:molybdopterin biosynthesis enzyme
MVVFSGGTSKGAGDLSYRAVHGLRNPGVVAHGVALKPGKPICLAVTEGKPVVVLPGFPTSAIFTFHEFVAPVLRAYAGLPAERRQSVAATLPMRVNSERGRTEYLLVGLLQGQHGLRRIRWERVRIRDHVQRRRLHHHRSTHGDPGFRQCGVGAVAGQVSSPPTW